jgi:hypothetical protein
MKHNLYILHITGVYPWWEFRRPIQPFHIHFFILSLSFRYPIFYLSVKIKWPFYICTHFVRLNSSVSSSHHFTCKTNDPIHISDLYILHITGVYPWWEFRRPIQPFHIHFCILSLSFRFNSFFYLPHFVIL